MTYGGRVPPWRFSEDRKRDCDRVLVCDLPWKKSYRAPPEQSITGLRVHRLPSRGEGCHHTRQSPRSLSLRLGYITHNGWWVVAAACGSDGGGFLDLAPARQGRWLSPQHREKRHRIGFFLEGTPCGCVDRRSASEHGSSSGEKRTRIPYGAPMALSYLY